MLLSKTHLVGAAVIAVALSGAGAVPAGAARDDAPASRSAPTGLAFAPENPAPGGSLTVWGADCGASEAVLVRTRMTSYGPATRRQVVVPAMADGSFVATVGLHGAPGEEPVVAGGDQFAVTAFCGGVDTSDRLQTVFGFFATTPGGPAPVADSATTPSGTPVVIDVLANDTGDDLRVVGSRNGPHGSIEIAPDGLSVTYSPDPGYVGTDLSEYTVRDSASRAARALIEVTVTGSPGGGDPVTPATAPTRVRALRVGGSATATRRTISWRAPASDGGARVATYRIVVRKGSRTLLTRNVGRSRRSVVVSRGALRTGAHVVWVRARNSAGWVPGPPGGCRSGGRAGPVIRHDCPRPA